MWMSSFALCQPSRGVSPRLTQLSKECALSTAACVSCLEAATASGLVDTHRHFVSAAKIFIEVSQTTASLSLRYDNEASHVLLALIRACERASADVARAAGSHGGEKYLACAEACRNCQRACADAVAVLRWR